MNTDTNDTRGKVELIEIEILYPDGTVVDTRIKPQEEDVGVIVFNDALLEKYVFPRLDAASSDTLRADWRASGKGWQHRPSFIALPGNGLTVREERYAACSLASHAISDSEKQVSPQDKNTVVRFPTIDSTHKAQIEKITDRGKINKMTILVGYPSGERAVTRFRPSSDYVGFLALSDEAVKNFLAPSLKEDDRSILNVWNACTDWRERYSFIWGSFRPSDGVIRFAAGSSPAIHPADDFLK